MKAELAKLTPEEREELLKDLESKESGAFAGQAIARKAYSTKISPKVLKVSPNLVRKAIIKLPSAPTPVCGNGMKEGTEQCDDGNKVNGDGCSANCMGEAKSAPPAPANQTMNQTKPQNVSMNATNTPSINSSSNTSMLNLVNDTNSTS